MKMPRDVSVPQLVKHLKILGYELSRQTGSHMRLTTFQNGQHHITIPNHDPLKLGTLSGILSAIAIHFDKSKDEIMQEIFN